jgi:uncharacterized membrane protein
MMNLTGVVIAITFAGIAHQPLYRYPPLVVVALTFALLGLVLIAQYRQWSTAPDEDDTPAEAWRFGIFYYNPADPSLIVAKRLGLGYTFNFANARSWVLLVLPLAIAGTLIVLLR